MPSVSAVHTPLILFVIVVFVPTIFCQHYYYIEINTSQGRLRGLRIKTARNKEALAFLGIPYATPPNDGLRFKVLDVSWDQSFILVVISLQWLIRDGMEFWTQQTSGICVRSTTREAINWEARIAFSSTFMRPLSE